MDLSGDLFHVLYIASKYLSVEKLIRLNMIDELILLLSQIEKIKCFVPEYKFLDELKQKIFCQFCLENKVEVITECGHHYCSDCLHGICDKYYQENRQIVCEICEEGLALVSDFMRFRRCRECEKYFFETYFLRFNEFNDFCIFCFWKCISNNSIRSERFLSFIKSSYFNCGRCGTATKFCNLTALCYSHLFCYECGKIGLEKEVCYSCDKVVSRKLIKDIKSLMVYQCYFCREHKEKLLFVEKFCCKYYICVRCQLSKERCLKCESLINFKIK